MKRRLFLKYMGLGAGAAVVGPSCLRKGDSDSVVPQTHRSGPMSMRTNHNTGDTVSLLGFGWMRLPMIEQPDGSKVIDQDEVNRMTDKAIAEGVNYFDTSPAYVMGKSEESLGIALSRHPRDKYFIATKLSNFAPETWPREKSIEMFENSLRYLRTDYIDYLLLHAIGGSSGDFDSMQTYEQRFVENGILDWLVEQKKLGRIRNLGFSYHGDVAVFNRLLDEMDRGLVHWDFVQIQHNYVDWLHGEEINPRNQNSQYLYGELEKRNIPAVVMEPLLGGRLANVPASVAAKMKQRRPDDSIASWAFRFAGSQPGILTVLSGMTYMEHLEDNLRTYSSLDPVSDEEVDFLQNVAMEIIMNNQVPCTACAYCMPCPFGVDIPGVFAHYNKCINDDNAPRSTQNPRYTEARRAFLVGYDRSVPRLRQAERCIACGACVPHCPQSIKIPAELRKIDQYVSNLKAGKA